jgi:hypothetical protein
MTLQANAGPLQAVALGLSVALLGAVSVLDASTGHEVTLSAFYLAPLGIAAWFGGPLAGTLMALACASSGFFVDNVLHQSVYEDPAAPYWNVLSRLTLYLIVMAILLRFRDSQRELVKTNASLAATLEESKRLMREITVLSEMGSMLHSCKSRTRQVRPSRRLARGCFPRSTVRCT